MHPLHPFQAGGVPFSSAQAASLGAFDAGYLDFPGLAQFAAAGPPVCSFPASASAQRENSGSVSQHSDAPLQQQGSIGQDEAQKALARQERLREKNRRAQRRLRERQKVQKEDLRKEVDQLTLHVSRLQQEKAQLQARTRTLERVVQLRDEQSTALAQPPANVNKSDADYIDEQVAQLRKVVVQGAPSTSSAALVMVPGTAATLASNGSSPAGQLYRELVGQLARTLLDGGDQPGSASHARLLELVHSCRDVMARCGLRNPAMFMSLESHYLDVMHRQHGQPAADIWRRVTDALQLSDTQVTMLLDMHAALRRTLDGLSRQREQVMAVFSSMSQPHLADRRSNTVCMAASQAAALLDANVKAEAKALYELRLRFFHEVLTPVQQARGMVEAYPVVVDVLAVCALLESQTSARAGGAGSQVQQYLPAQLGQHAALLRSDSTKGTPSESSGGPALQGLSIVSVTQSGSA